MMGRDGFPYWLVLISGPPRSGKNRAGVCLAERLDADHFALSNMLKRMTHQHFGLGLELPPLAFEDCKDEPMPQFGGLSPRDAYIMFSETIMKPKLGGDCLGRTGRERVAANRAERLISVVSGVGFLEEISPMINAAGARSSLHIKIKPVTDTAVEDSREHLNLARLGVTEIQVENPGCADFLASLRRELPDIQF